MTSLTASAQDRLSGGLPLSSEQQQVVDHGDGALLVFAGPGSGKTRTLTARIAELLAGGRAKPQEILALTFTVRATEEMRVRLTALIGQQAASAVTVATFHSLGARILRLHAGAFGRTASYSIYDSDDVLRVIRDVVADGEHVDCELLADFPKDVLTQIAMAKSRLWSPAVMRDRAQHPDRGRIVAVWEGVEREMRQSNAFDFADLLTNSVALLTDDPVVRTRYRAWWRHIVVDEFQDTDPSQFALLARLAGPSGCAPGGSLIVAGDDDQLLYRWRGADVDNLLGFRDAYPCAKELTLRRNYRCRPEILEAATLCIRHNERRRAEGAAGRQAPRRERRRCAVLQRPPRGGRGVPADRRGDHSRRRPARDPRPVPVAAVHAAVAARADVGRHRTPRDRRALALGTRRGARRTRLRRAGRKPARRRRVSSRDQRPD